MNLHLFLYHQAGLKRVAARGNENHVAGEEWNAALSFYRSDMVSRDLLKDDAMVGIEDALDSQENSPSLTPNGPLTPVVVSHLERAASFYRGNLWGHQNDENQRWIRSVAPLVDRHGPELAEELSAAYETAWPDTPIRVDVANYAGWAGAFTTLDPTRITISSLNPGNQGRAALEVLFHEASHSLARKLQLAISAECKRNHLLLPRRDLWHAIIFYTTGEFVRRLIPDYVPYAIKNGLWSRAWPMYFAALDRDWKPYLDGRTSFQSAVGALVRDVGRPAGGPP